jgi:UDP-galactopyranose mutase
MKSFDYLIVGCGLAGIVIGRLLSEDSGNTILMIDKRLHIGGLCYDYYDNNGLLVQPYGGHIFHTNNKRVWDFLSKFTEWNYYQHKVYSYVDGQYHLFPPKGKPLSFGIVPDNAEEYLIVVYGKEICDKFYRNYTKKHWNRDLSELPSEIVSRVQVRISDDPRYFLDRYQGLPKYGFTKMFEEILRAPNIKIMLNTDFREISPFIKFNKVVWTGGLDDLLEYRYGKLQYLSRKFYVRTFEKEFYQNETVINYPNDYDFIRVLELKHATGQKSFYTNVLYEYPIYKTSDEHEPFYPLIIDEQERQKYSKYQQLLSENHKNTHVLGRLAEYLYLDMDKVIERAFALYEDIAS